ALEALVAGLVEMHVGPTTVGSFILATPHGVVVSPAGLTVGAAELPGLAIDVQYVPVPGATITAPATLTLTQGLLTATGGAALLAGTTYRYTFASLPSFATGVITIHLGSWSDSVGNAAAAGDLGTITLAGAPTSTIVPVGTGGAVATTELGTFT